MKTFEKMSDAECRLYMAGPHHMCEVHGQFVIECANQRLAQVKAAREMADRRTRWAKAWKDSACRNRVEINQLRM